MIKRVVIAGCRYYQNYEQAKQYIERCLCRLKREHTIIILSGGCTGADKLGERYATEMGLAVERYTANWEKYGKSAGPRRNEEMARQCDYVICFWDGKSRGTRSMIACATALGKPIRIIKIE